MHSTSAKTKPSGLSPLSFARSLWRHRELLWQFTLRNVEMRTRGSHLGLIWSVINPLLMMGLYVFVFGYIFGGKFSAVANETKIDFALALFLGLTVFQVFAEVFAISPTVIISNPNFVKKVVFPLEILPASNVAASLFHFLIALFLVLLGVAVIGPGLKLSALWLPVILVPVILYALGIAWFFAAVGVFFRDIGQLVGFVSMVLMYASAIFYPLSMLPERAWAVLKYNPILLAIDLARNAVMWNQPMNFWHLSYLTVSSLCFCIVGYWCFRKMAPAFADVL